MMSTITGLPQCSIVQALLVDSNKILILIVILKLYRPRMPIKKLQYEIVCGEVRCVCAISNVNVKLNNNLKQTADGF
jgi:hypothetical protein